MPEPTPPQPVWMPTAAVAAGGALGALARFGVEVALLATVDSVLLAASLSLGAVNVLGAAGLGGLLGWIDRHGGPDALRPLVGIGGLGAFTTFSGFVAHLRVLEAEAGAWATALFFMGSCCAAGVLFDAARNAPADGAGPS
ncbi:MAG: CrcB family protein [Myxococcota bacterium]